MIRLRNLLISFFLILLRYISPEISSKLSLEGIKLIHSINNKSFNPKLIKTSEEIIFKKLRFKNYLGLAAGLDKKGNYFNSLGSMGFSFIEVGTFTPQPQLGNNLPRIKRFKDSNSLINRLGFNNPGIIQGMNNIQKNIQNYQGILGISIGKNKNTSLEDAHKDYVFCLQKAFNLADYIAINISSPNTKNLRKLSSEGYIEDLLKNIYRESKNLEKVYKKKVPLFLKLSPDENESNLKSIIRTSDELGIEGFIISNTTYGNYQGMHGGISGELLRDKSLELLRKTTNLIGKESLIVASGGISNKNDLEERLDNGAKLVQIYTSFIYKGPQIVEELLN